jgi:hypothetical protein
MNHNQCSTSEKPMNDVYSRLTQQYEMEYQKSMTFLLAKIEPRIGDKVLNHLKRLFLFIDHQFDRLSLSIVKFFYRNRSEIDWLH